MRPGYLGSPSLIGTPASLVFRFLLLVLDLLKIVIFTTLFLVIHLGGLKSRDCLRRSFRMEYVEYVGSPYPADPGIYSLHNGEGGGSSNLKRSFLSFFFASNQTGEDPMN